MSELMEKRLPYVDRLKGLAIFLVVIGHVLQQFYTDSEFTNAFAVRLIYAFHMPLFMFLSGYVCFKKQDWGLVKKRAAQLLIPFFSYIFLAYGINVALGEENDTLSQFFIRVILRPDGGLWFLWVLFFITVIFIACRKLASKTNIPEWLIMLSTGAVLNGIVIFCHFRIFGFHWIAWYFLYFYIGALWRSRVASIHETRKTDIKILYSGIVLFAIMLPFFRMHNEAPTFYRWINLGNLFPVAYRFVIGLAGIAMTYEAIKLCQSNAFVLRQLSKWGGVTLGIYYIHYQVIRALFCIPITGTWQSIVAICAYSIFTTYLCYLLSKIFLRNRLSSCLIMGKGF